MKKNVFRKKWTSCDWYKRDFTKMITYVMVSGKMKKVLSAVLVSSVFLLPIHADRLDDLNQETDRLWRRGRGAEDGGFTAMYTSMLAWGVGIGAAAALIAIFIESSESGGGSAHTHCH